MPAEAISDVYITKKTGERVPWWVYWQQREQVVAIRYGGKLLSPQTLNALADAFNTLGSSVRELISAFQKFDISSALRGVVNLITTLELLQKLPEEYGISEQMRVAFAKLRDELEDKLPKLMELAVQNMMEDIEMLKNAIEIMSSEFGKLAKQAYLANNVIGTLSNVLNAIAVPTSISNMANALLQLYNMVAFYSSKFPQLKGLLPALQSAVLKLMPYLEKEIGRLTTIVALSISQLDAEFARFADTVTSVANALSNLQQYLNPSQMASAFTTPQGMIGTLLSYANNLRNIIAMAKRLNMIDIANVAMTQYQLVLGTLNNYSGLLVDVLKSSFEMILRGLSAFESLKNLGIDVNVINALAGALSSLQNAFEQLYSIRPESKIQGYLQLINVYALLKAVGLDDLASEIYSVLSKQKGKIKDALNEALGDAISEGVGEASLVQLRETAVAYANAVQQAIRIVPERIQLSQLSDEGFYSSIAQMVLSLFNFARTLRESGIDELEEYGKMLENTAITMLPKLDKAWKIFGTTLKKRIDAFIKSLQELRKALGDEIADFSEAWGSLGSLQSFIRNFTDAVRRSDVYSQADSLMRLAQSLATLKQYTDELGISENDIDKMLKIVGAKLKALVPKATKLLLDFVDETLKKTVDTAFEPIDIITKLPTTWSSAFGTPKIPSQTRFGGYASEVVEFGNTVKRAYSQLAGAVGRLDFGSMYQALSGWISVLMSMDEEMAKKVFGDIGKWKAHLTKMIMARNKIVEAFEEDIDDIINAIERSATIFAERLKDAREMMVTVVDESGNIVDLLEYAVKLTLTKVVDIAEYIRNRQFNTLLRMFPHANIYTARGIATVSATLQTFQILAQHINEPGFAQYREIGLTANLVKAGATLARQWIIYGKLLRQMLGRSVVEASIEQAKMAIELGRLLSTPLRALYRIINGQVMTLRQAVNEATVSVKVLTIIGDEWVAVNIRLKDIADTIQFGADMISEAGGLLESVLTLDIGGFFTHLENLSKYIAVLTDTTGLVIDLTPVQTALMQAYQPLIAMFSSLASTIMGVFAPAISTLISLSTAIAPILAVASVVPLLAMAFQLFAGLLKMLGVQLPHLEGASRFIGAIINVLGALWNVFVGMWNVLAQLLSIILAPLMAIIDALFLLLASPLEWLAGMLNTLADVFNFIAQLLQPVVNVFVAIGQAIIDFVKIIIDFFNSVWQVIAGFINAVVALVQPLLALLGIGTASGNNGPQQVNVTVNIEHAEMKTPGDSADLAVEITRQIQRERWVY